MVRSKAHQLSRVKQDGDELGQLQLRDVDLPPEKKQLKNLTAAGLWNTNEHLISKNPSRIFSFYLPTISIKKHDSSAELKLSLTIPNLVLIGSKCLSFGFSAMINRCNKET